MSFSRKIISFVLFPLFLFAIFLCFISPSLTVSAEQTVPSSSDIHFSDDGRGLAFHQFYMPMAGFFNLATSGSSVTSNFSNFRYHSFVLQRTAQDSPNTYTFGFSNPASDGFSIFAPFLSTNRQPMFGSLVDGTDCGYIVSPSSSSWGSATGYTAFPSLNRLSFETGTTVMFSLRSDYLYGSSSKSNPIYTRFAVYNTGAWDISKLLYFRFEDVKLGELTPDGINLYSYTPGLPLVQYDDITSSANSIRYYYPAKVVFYDNSERPVLIFYYIGFCYSNHLDASLHGLTRYSSANVSTQDAWSQAYNQGFSAGNSSGYDSGYNVGITEGSKSGYENGYNIGYTDGVNASNQYSFFSLISSVLSAPIGAVTGLLDFDVLGVNMSSFFFSLLTVCIIIKLVTVVV